MSHYAVAVFHMPDQDIDELLAPYDENLETEPYLRYTKQEAIKEARALYGPDYTDEELYEIIADGYIKDDDGNLLSTYNQNAKWDWYVIGGRFSDMLKLKASGDWTDSAKVADIDFSPDEEEYQSAIRFWEVVIDGEALRDGENSEDFYTFYKPEYLKGRYLTKENYASLRAAFHTYAVITPDGEWHAPGEMGYFAMTSETDEEGLNWDLSYKKTFIDAADPNWSLTIVDCHI